MGQERYLLGLRLTWKCYQALRGNWEHEHCGFCFKKSLDAEYADWMREALASGPNDYAAAGFTNLRHDEAAAGRHWICRACFDDFVNEYGWEVADTDPNAWPYDTPEPSPRPTAADYDPDAPSRGP